MTPLLFSLSLTTPTTALFLLLFLYRCCSSGVCKVVFDDCSFLKGCNTVERERLKKKEKLRNLDEKKGEFNWRKKKEFPHTQKTQTSLHVKRTYS